MPNRHNILIMYKLRIYLLVYQHLTRGIAYKTMAGFLTCSPMIGRLPEVIKTQWQQDLPGLQNLQLRVQFRICTGFPFTSGQRKPNRYTIIRWQKYEIYWKLLYLTSHFSILAQTVSVTKAPTEWTAGAFLPVFALHRGRTEELYFITLVLISTACSPSRGNWLTLVRYHRAVKFKFIDYK